jgi:hypothetical protein
MALKVEERDGKGFYWILLQAHDHFEVSDGLHYRVSHAATSPRANYWEALLLGMSELRRILGDAAGDAASAGGIDAFATATARDEDGVAGGQDMGHAGPSDRAVPAGLRESADGRRGDCP